jgi:hypothetical protein
VKLGTENRKQTIIVAVLGGLLLVLVAYEFLTFSSSSTSASTATEATDLPQPPAPGNAKGNSRTGQHSGSRNISGKKERAAQSLDPTLHLDQLMATEQIKYEGSGRNIFVAQADIPIPTPLAPGQTDPGKPVDPPYHAPPIAPAPPIPLKFFGFSNQPGEPKRVFLAKGEDIFIAAEGEIVDRRYKVVKISPTSVDIQDVVNSGPPQSIPLTQGSGNPT